MAIVGKDVHFLLHDVGAVADAALKEGGLLHDRRAQLTKAVAAENLAGQLLDAIEGLGFAGQRVVHALDGAEWSSRECATP